jgi:hypothetical protein
MGMTRETGVGMGNQGEEVGFRVPRNERVIAREEGEIALFGVGKKRVN